MSRVDALLGCLPDAGPALSRGYLVAGTGAAVTVSCIDPGVLLRCDRLAGHAYTIGPPRPPDSGWRVAHVPVTPEVLAAAPAAFAGAPSVQVVTDLPARYLTAGSGATVFLTDRDRSVIHVDPARRAVRLWSCDHQAGRRWVPELVRHAMTTQMHTAAAVHVRGAAVVVGGVGVLILGPPGSGTTTSVLAALRLLDADLVTAGRLLLARDRSLGLVGYPWPSPVTLRSGSLRAWPTLRQHLGAPDPRPHVDGDVVTLDPAHTELLLTRGRLADRVHPRLVLWPRLAFDCGADPGPGPPLRTDIVRSWLERSRLGLRDLHPGPAGPARSSGTAGQCGSGGSGEGLTDWLSHPAFPFAADRPMTPAFRAVVDDLVELPHRVLLVTAQPAGIAAQIHALLHPAPRPGPPAHDQPHPDLTRRHPTR